MKGTIVATVLAMTAAVAMAGALPGAGTGARQARWFLGGNVTETVTVYGGEVTRKEPWTCIAVAPTLLPCRKIRSMDIDATPPTPIAATAAPHMARSYGGMDYQLAEAARRYYLDASYYGDMVPVPNAPQGGWMPMMPNARAANVATEPLPAPAAAAPAAATPVATAPAPAQGAAPANGNAAAPAVPDQGWLEWLGLRAHTYTTTLYTYSTKVVQEPDVAVTINLSGCVPSKLPIDLPACVPPAQYHEPTEASTGAAPAAAAAVPSVPEPAPAAAAPADKPKPDAAPAPSMAPIVVAADKPAEPAAAAAAEPEAPAATP